MPTLGKPWEQWIGLFIFVKHDQNCISVAPGLGGGEPGKNDYESNAMVAKLSGLIVDGVSNVRPT